ncbi:MAG TPA: ParB-like protein [Nevskiaceae bacterium]|nr:ParB-like protein [Nevskiaceae bacterium]
MSKLHECKVEHLRPTQITVGMLEVHDKRQHLRELGHHQRREFLREHAIPAVLGPNEKLYLTDHHHLGRALVDENIEHGFFLIEADLSALTDHAAFWLEMNARQWAHPVDPQGRRHDCTAIPHHLAELVDDPYRSLAGYVRNAGGYCKTQAAFAEFQWADFFRRHVTIGAGHAAFAAAVAQALALARSPLAQHLPGYGG